MQYNSEHNKPIIDPRPNCNVTTKLPMVSQARALTQGEAGVPPWEHGIGLPHDFRDTPGLSRSVGLTAP